MPVYSSEGNGGLTARQLGAAGLLLVVSVTLTFLPPAAQQYVSTALTASILRPFIFTHEVLTTARFRAETLERVTAERDSLVASLATVAPLLYENQELRRLLDLKEPIGSGYRAANVIRPGTAGSRSTFLLDIGTNDGVRPDSPVLTSAGVVGLVIDVLPNRATAMDWSHPDFRASAVTLAGDAYGIVEPRRSTFSEGDRLLFDGIAYFTDFEPGTVVLTSGSGGIFPRGIPLGTIDGIADEGEGWRRSYWLRPASQLGDATQVLVEVARGADSDEAQNDSLLWSRAFDLMDRHLSGDDPESDVETPPDSMLSGGGA